MKKIKMIFIIVLFVLFTPIALFIIYSFIETSKIEKLSVNVLTSVQQRDDEGLAKLLGSRKQNLNMPVIKELSKDLKGQTFEVIHTERNHYPLVSDYELFVKIIEDCQSCSVLQHDYIMIRLYETEDGIEHYYSKNNHFFQPIIRNKDPQ